MPGNLLRIPRVATLCAAALLCACSSDSGAQFGAVGTLSLNLEAQIFMLNPDGSTSDVRVPGAPESDRTAVTMMSAGGEYTHSWPAFDDFPQDDDYIAGSYLLRAACGNPDDEGFDTPVFAGETTAVITEGSRTDASLTLGMINTGVITRFGTLADGGVTLTSLGFLTPGGKYHPYTPDTEGMLCLRCGDATIYATLTDGDRSLSLSLGKASLPLPGTLYTCSATLEAGKLTFDAPGLHRDIPLSAGLFDGRSPRVTVSDNLASTLVLAEGEKPDSPALLTVTPGSRPLASIILSTLSPSLQKLDGYPLEADLLDASQRRKLEEFGAVITDNDGEITIDISSLLARLVYLDDKATERSTFTLIATDIAGLTSSPVAADIVSTPVDLEISVPEAAVMGIDIATLDITCPSDNFASNLAVSISTPGAPDRQVDVTVTPTRPGHYDVSFPIGEGSTPVTVKVLYCDELRSTIKIPRVMPPFTIEVDPHALGAVIRIVPSDPDLTRVITERVNLYIDSRECPLYARFPDRGCVAVVGLDAATTYSFKATMMTGVDDPDFTPAVSARTESTRQLPNPSFEDRADGPKYLDLPSGGRYSQTQVEIFNWQHKVTFAHEVPKGWANVNAKTFCKAASNHNTWYMQPSAYLSRKYAVDLTFSAVIRSTGFDLEGEPIPDYAQTGKPYLDYSPIIPTVRNRAAGKLFLGSYTFDPSTMTETYTEGIPFTSRPESLNGSYKFIPATSDRTDCGLAIIEVIGRQDDRDIVIASARQALPLSWDFRTFSIPLTYNIFGVQATKIKVMFASSSHIGTIDEETASVPLHFDAPTATASGGELWLDNITLSY